jgi:predicted kinase
MATATDNKGFTEQRFDYSAGRANAPELIMMVGISGSGKSVHAKSLVNWGRGSVVRLNRDSIRAMLFCDVPWNSNNENLVRNWQMEGARQALQMGKDVIIDDTNCVRNTRQKWEEFAKQARVRFRVITMTTDIKTCIERDAQREGKERVGEGVIRKQHKDLNEVKVTVRDEKPMVLTRPYLERTELLRNGGFLPRLPGCPWVLVDMDGTTASFTDLKTGAVLRGPFEEHKVMVDDVYPVVAEWVRALYPFYNICVVSGRHDFCGDDSCDWLEMHGIPFDHILMRYSDDNRSDHIVKKEILDELCAVVGKENIAFVLDDRPKVVRMWRDNGVRVFPVRGGTDHTPGCPTAGSKGYRTCPDCGALEDF